MEGGTCCPGTATCPVTGFTTKVDRVRAQLKSRRGGRPMPGFLHRHHTGVGARAVLPAADEGDQEAFDAAAVELERREKEGTQRSQKAAG